MAFKNWSLFYEEIYIKINNILQCKVFLINILALLLTVYKEHILILNLKFYNKEKVFTYAEIILKNFGKIKNNSTFLSIILISTIF